MIKTAILAGALVLATSSAMAQQCSAGPKCSQASSRAQTYMSKLNGGGGVHGSSAKAYCLNKVGEAVAQACAKEMTELGKPQCASLAKQQQAEHLRVANQAASAAGASYAGSNWRASCGF